MEETFHVTFNEVDEAIRHSGSEADDINFNEERSFLDDEFSIQKKPSKRDQRYESTLQYIHTFNPLSTNNKDTEPLITSPENIIT